jgi:hypothetical protein
MMASPLHDDIRSDLWLRARVQQENFLYDSILYRII